MNTQLSSPLWWTEILETIAKYLSYLLKEIPEETRELLGHSGSGMIRFWRENTGFFEMCQDLTEMDTHVIRRHWIRKGRARPWVTKIRHITSWHSNLEAVDTVNKWGAVLCCQRTEQFSCDSYRQLMWWYYTPAAHVKLEFPSNWVKIVSCAGLLTASQQLLSMISIISVPKVFALAWRAFLE